MSSSTEKVRIFTTHKIFLSSFLLTGDCDYKDSLLARAIGFNSLCQDIPGDAVLYSMIRVLSKPVECPLQGPYSVSYGKGGADVYCSHPPSLVDSCSNNSVLQVFVNSFYENSRINLGSLLLAYMKLTSLDTNMRSVVVNPSNPSSSLFTG